MATANDLLTRAIDETKHLNHNEIFLVRDLFKGYEWNRISRSPAPYHPGGRPPRRRDFHRSHGRAGGAEKGLDRAEREICSQH